MNSYIVHPDDHQGEGEDHHEKKSVLKKVKDKAKKIKDTFKKQGHGHDNHERHIPDNHDLDKEDDEKDENPEVQANRSGVPGQGEISKVPVVKVGDTEVMHDIDNDTVEPNLESTDVKISDPVQPEPGVMLMHEDVVEPRANYSGTTTASVLGGHEEISGQPKGTSEMEGGLHSPQNTLSSFGDCKSNVTDHPSQTFASGMEGHLGQNSRVNLYQPKELEEDPYVPKVNPQADTPSNCQTKVTDPSPTNAGGEEVGITPVLHSLDKMNIDAGTKQSSYTDKISSATSAIADKEIPAKNVVASKLGYGENNDQQGDIKHQAYTASTNTAGGEEVGNTPVLHSLDKMNIDAGTEQSSYTDKISSATSAIADKEIPAKNVVASKLGYGENNDQQGDIKHQAYTASTNAAVGDDEQEPHQNLSTGTYNSSAGSHDQFSAERPSNQSSTYTEQISSATSAIAVKAISAKNFVASTLGYGGNNDDDDHPQEVTAKSGESTAPEQHGKTIATTVTQKPTSVYEKVAEAGSTVMSKIQGTGTGTGSTDGKEVSQSKAVQDKGASGKDYFAEKLKPGEEDKALSEVISEALPKRKAEHSAGPVGEVTESVDVSRRLGPDDGIEKLEQSSYGKIVSDSVKGAVGSLFGGKAGETPSSQQSTGSSTGGTNGFSSSESGAAEHRSLPRSGN